MEWKFNNDAPIYAQLIAQVRQGIASGIFSPGEQLKPVRELALEAGVNPNTVQRALSELEREGLLFTQRTAGRFVTEDLAVITDVRSGLAKEHAGRFLDAMSNLGYKNSEIIDIIKNSMEENENAGT